MNSILFDTNALIYWLYRGSPYYAEVAELIVAALQRGLRLYVLCSSLNDAYYALRRHYMSEPDARASIDDAAGIFTLVDLTEQLVHASIASDEPDYEDGLIRVSAEQLAVDAIVSYDARAFTASTVAKMTAREALDALTVGG